MSIADTFQPVLGSPLAVRQMPHHLKEPFFRSMAKGAHHRSANSVFMRDGRNDSTARKAPASVDDVAHMLLPVFAVRRSLRASPRADDLVPRRLRKQLQEMSACFLARAPTDNCRISKSSRDAFAAWLPLRSESFSSHRIFSARSKKETGLYPSERSARTQLWPVISTYEAASPRLMRASKIKKRGSCEAAPPVQEHEQNPWPSPETVAGPFAKSFAMSSVHCQYIRGQ